MSVGWPLLVRVLCAFPDEQQDCGKRKGSKAQPPTALCLWVSVLPLREDPGPHLGDLPKWGFWTELPIQMKWIIKQPYVPLLFCFTSNKNNLDKKWIQCVHSTKFVPSEVTFMGQGDCLDIISSCVFPESTGNEVCECVHECACAKPGDGDWQRGTGCGWNLTISFSSPSLSKACWPFSRWSPMETRSAPAPRPLLAAASRTNSRATSWRWIKELMILQVKNSFLSTHTFFQQMTILSQVDSSPGHFVPGGISGCSLLLHSLKAAVSEEAAPGRIFLDPTYRGKTHCLPTACQPKASDCKSSGTMRSWQDPREKRAQELPGRCFIPRN